MESLHFGTLAQVHWLGTPWWDLNCKAVYTVLQYQKNIHPPLVNFIWRTRWQWSLAIAPTLQVISNVVKACSLFAQSITTDLRPANTPSPHFWQLFRTKACEAHVSSPSRGSEGTLVVLGAQDAGSEKIFKFVCAQRANDMPCMGYLPGLPKRVCQQGCIRHTH